MIIKTQKRDRLMANQIKVLNKYINEPDHENYLYLKEMSLEVAKILEKIRPY